MLAAIISAFMPFCAKRSAEPHRHESAHLIHHMCLDAGAEQGVHEFQGDVFAIDSTRHDKSVRPALCMRTGLSPGEVRQRDICNSTHIILIV